VLIISHLLHPRQIGGAQVPRVRSVARDADVHIRALEQLVLGDAHRAGRHRRLGGEILTPREHLHVQRPAKRAIMPILRARRADGLAARRIPRSRLLEAAPRTAASPAGMRRTAASMSPTQALRGRARGTPAVCRRHAAVDHRADVDQRGAQRPSD